MPAKPESARKLFAANLRQRRLHLGLSQEEFASRCGLHRTYIGSVERGERNVSIDNMERIAAALGVDIASLLRNLRKKSGLVEQLLELPRR